MYEFLEQLSPAWVNAITIISSAFGILFSLYAFWFSKKLSNEGNQLIAELNNYTAAINAQTIEVHKNTKILRLDNLRSLYDYSRDTEHNKYWHFRWRFETFNHLGISVKVNERSFFYRLKILGQNYPSNNVGLESPNNMDIEAYIVEAYEYLSEDSGAPLTVGTKYYAYFFNGKKYLSRGQLHSDLDKFEFSISTLGRPEFRYGNAEDNVDSEEIFLRVKDS